MSEREPGWYWVKLWPTAQWQPALYRFEAGVIGPHPEGFWMAHAMQGVLLDNSLAEIGPRILPLPVPTLHQPRVSTQKK